ncbi:oligosaccharide flippase family protein [Alteromonas sp. ASW11-36]|uniref:Oligosaccharide flippase family protein n=1 Tax=Alteromonas arenosi TaxID=3055817 RepID=A0ABT7SSY1_9ALTE|nr:oligosaccharide flippase family protein [Alteromonas sp. ASW11-36]MDM7859303.1 oligosaccharide flippase family protein [Alteromonas sp. ASW11-36]
MGVAQKVLSTLSSRLVANASWSIGAEVCAKFIRIFSLFALAWILPMDQYGLAMLALALQDVVRLLMRCGAGAQVVQCSNDSYPSTLYNGVALQWILCIALTAGQVGLGWLAAAFYEQQQLFTILAWSAPVLLAFPIVCARVFSATRNNNLRLISIATAIGLSLENLSIAISAYWGAGIYAIVIGKYVFAMVWIIYFLRLPSPVLVGEFDLTKVKSMFVSSGKLACSEALRAVKIHLDLFVAGKFMTPDMVGVYSVARNASFGISQSFLLAFEQALYPYLCKLRRDNAVQSLVKLLSVIGLIITAGLALQSLLVPYYLPLLFGDKWQLATTAAAYLCIAMIPAVAVDLCCTALRSKAAFSFESWLRAVFIITFIVGLISTSATSANAFALVVVSCNVAGVLVVVTTLLGGQYITNQLLQKENAHE